MDKKYIYNSAKQYIQIKIKYHYVNIVLLTNN